MLGVGRHRGRRAALHKPRDGHGVERRNVERDGRPRERVARERLAAVELHSDGGRGEAGAVGVRRADEAGRDEGRERLVVALVRDDGIVLRAVRDPEVEGQRVCIGDEKDAAIGIVGLPP